MDATLTFLGAAGTVTGSKYLLRGSRRVLVDCGLFQGYKQLRLRNRAPFPIDPRTIDAVVLTHAHLDHSGYLPLLVKNGYGGKIYCTAATRDLCEVLLPDSGRLQEEEAEYANRHEYSKHKPALPLYTADDAERALAHLVAINFREAIELADDLRFDLQPAGHILGAAQVHVELDGISLLFSGDLGRPDDPLMPPPAPPRPADYVIVESTYGNRRHEAGDPAAELAEVVNRTATRGGIVIVPSFAVGRAQTLLYFIQRLKRERTIPDIPVFLNSPMATDAMHIFTHHPADHRLTPSEVDAMCRAARIVTSVEESKRLDELDRPAIIIAGSGMATGGRVLHHLKRYAPDARNTILFVGFQAGGTRGAAMIDGAESIKIHGAYVPVCAEVALINRLSAHADADETLAWLKQMKTPPRQTFVTHGEPSAADTLRRRIAEELRWPATVPEHLGDVALVSDTPPPR